MQTREGMFDNWCPSLRTAYHVLRQSLIIESSILPYVLTRLEVYGEQPTQDWVTQASYPHICLLFLSGRPAQSSPSHTILSRQKRFKPSTWHWRPVPGAPDSGTFIPRTYVYVEYVYLSNKRISDPAGFDCSSKIYKPVTSMQPSCS